MSSQPVKYCAFCGKSLSEGEDHCAKCGRSAELAVTERPRVTMAKYHGPTVTELRDRTTRIGWLIGGAVAAVVVAGLIAYFGLYVMPSRKPAEVHPEVADQPLAQALDLPAEDPHAAPPEGPVNSPDEAIERVAAVPEVMIWQHQMEAAGAKVQLAVADEDDKTYRVQVFEVVDTGGEAHTATMGWYIVEKATGKTYAESETAGGDGDAERPQLEKMAAQAAGLRSDHVEVLIAEDWAFADVAEKDASGQWARATSVLMRKTDGKWKVIATGDSTGWQLYRAEMSPAVQAKFDSWQISHL